MRLPILSSARELDLPARRFLLFFAVNVISWQCLVGPALILFARHIDMPTPWVGALMSFMPLAMTLVIFMAPLVERYGPRRVLLVAWAGRFTMAGGMFLMPWAMARWGQEAGWYVLIASVLGFCICRSFGVGGWFPWLHEIVAERQRGLYFSIEMTIFQVANVVVGLVIALILLNNATIERFLFICGCGIAAGMAGLILLARIPGGRVAPRADEERRRVSSYSQALADHDFLRFTVLCAGVIFFLSFTSAATILFLRDALGLRPFDVMLITSMGGVCVALSIRFWGRYADQRGSARAIVLTVLAHSVAAGAWLALRPDAAVTLWLVATVYTCGTMFFCFFWVGAHRGMLCLIKEDGRVGYTNLWVVATSMAGGLAPILVGQVIEMGQAHGFQICFAISAAGGLMCALACLRLPTEEGKPEMPTPSQALRLTTPARVLGRVIGVTVGLEESREPANDA